MKLCMNWCYIRSSKNYQNSSLGHAAFLMTSSFFLLAIEVKYFDKQIKFPVYNYLGLKKPCLLERCY